MKAILASLLLLARCAGAAPQPVPPRLPSVGSLEVSHPDARGHFVVSFDPGPIDLYMPGYLTAAQVEELAQMGIRPGLRRVSHVVPLPAGCIVAVRSFIGWDAGSIGEATLELDVDGYRLFERSDHKEAPTNYDAWRGPIEASFVPRAPGSTGRENVIGRGMLSMTFSAEQLAPRTVDGGYSTRAHGAFRLEMSTCR